MIVVELVGLSYPVFSLALAWCELLKYAEQRSVGGGWIEEVRVRLLGNAWS